MPAGSDAVEEHLLEDAGLKAEGLRLLGAIEVDPAITSRQHDRDSGRGLYRPAGQTR